MHCKQHINYSVLILSIIFVLVFASFAISDDVKTDVEFENQVLSILKNSCFSCHSAPKTDSDGTITQPKGGVQLDSVKGIANSRLGEVIIANEPDDSLLYQRITLPEGETGIMPPSEESGPLTKEQTDLIRKWIEQGANFGDWKGNISQHNTSGRANSHQPSVMPPITSLVLTHDGKSVVASTQAGLHIYDYPTLKLQRTIKVKAHNIHDLAFSPDGDLLAVGGGNPATEGTVEILSWADGKTIKVLKGHRDSVISVAWRDSSLIATGSLDRRIILWNINTETQLQVLVGHSKGVSSLCYLKDNDTLVSTGIDQSIRVWNATTGELLRSLNNHTQAVHDLALRPNNTGLPMVASASDDQTVRFWQPSIGRMVKFARLKAGLLTVAWLNSGSRVAAACNDGSIYIIDPDSVEVVDTIPAIDGWIYSLIVHPTDSSIIVGGIGGQIKRILPEQPK